MFQWLPGLLLMKRIYANAVYACFFNRMKYFTNSYWFVNQSWPVSNSEAPAL